MENNVLKAGGIIMRTNEEGEREIFVVHRPRHEDWSLPKGHIDEGEDPEEAAVREIREETGMKCHVVTGLPDNVYTMPDGKQSVVKMFMCEPINDEQFFAPEDKEVDEGKWVTLSEAHELLTYEGTVEYLKTVFAE